MSNKVHVSHPTKKVNCTIDLARSKSESNRALIINALSGNKTNLQGLANARDTETMQRLLNSDGEEWDVLDAGTTMRFCTAFAAATGRKVVMTGTDRMCQRPIGILVDALRELGADIEYLSQDGYPPHRINGFAQKTNELVMRGDVSSQFISAIIMIAPTLPQGLNLTLDKKVASWPYLDMTIRMMKDFGAQITHDAEAELRSLRPGETIRIAPGGYQNPPTNFYVEADWSGASYWYSIAALADEADISIKGLKHAEMSVQGDAVLDYNHYNSDHTGIMEKLGVKTEYDEHEKITRLTKVEEATSFNHDFTFCPDIAQTISVICAAKKIPARLTGLESLRIKETDRIDAIKQQLEKFDVEVSIEGDEAIEINPSQFNQNAEVEIDTYDDHRMAMAFAPLALLNNLVIEDKTVVNKSYPDFWRDLETAGFVVKDN